MMFSITMSLSKIASAVQLSLAFDDYNGETRLAPSCLHRKLHSKFGQMLPFIADCIMRYSRGRIFLRPVMAWLLVCPFSEIILYSLLSFGSKKLVYCPESRSVHLLVLCQFQLVTWSVSVLRGLSASRRVHYRRFDCSHIS